jgi:hypothetical protein
MLDQPQIEGIACDLYRAAGFSPDSPVDPLELARGLMGRRAVRFVGDTVLIHHNAAVSRIGTEWRLYLRKGLPDRVRRFSCAHEIGEWFLARQGLADADVEASADALAAAILAPKPFAAQACRRGPRYPQLAKAFGSTESCAALRFGEVTDRPLVLVTARCTRERGAPFPWPADSELRSDARLPGLAKAWLRDDPSRLVVRAG